MSNFDTARAALAEGHKVALDRCVAIGSTSIGTDAVSSMRADAANRAGERLVWIFADADGKRVQVRTRVTRDEARELKTLGATYRGDDGTEATVKMTAWFWHELGM